MIRQTETDLGEGARRAMTAVMIVGAMLAFSALWMSGVRDAVSVAAGALLGVANLWVVARVVRAFLGGASPLPWTVVVVFKLTALYGGLYLLATSGFVSLLALAIGWGALPLGIVFAGLSPVPTAEQKG